MAGRGQLGTPAVDHFKCFKAKRARARATGITVVDQFGTKTVDVRKPAHLCAPTDKNGEGVLDPSGFLMCYKVRERSEPFRGLEPVFLDDQFRVTTTRLERVLELCVPSTADLPP